MNTKKAPRSDEQVREMAEAFQRRKVEQKGKKHQQQVKQVEAYIREGNQPAVDTAVAILRESRPDLLAESITENAKG